MSNNSNYGNNSNYEGRPSDSCCKPCRSYDCCPPKDECCWKNENFCNAEVKESNWKPCTSVNEPLDGYRNIHNNNNGNNGGCGCGCSGEKNNNREEGSDYLRKYKNRENFSVENNRNAGGYGGYGYGGGYGGGGVRDNFRENFSKEVKVEERGHNRFGGRGFGGFGGRGGFGGEGRGFGGRGGFGGEGRGFGGEGRGFGGEGRGFGGGWGGELGGWGGELGGWGGRGWGWSGEDVPRSYLWDLSATRRCLPGLPAAKLVGQLGYNSDRISGQKWSQKIHDYGAYGSWT